MKLKLCPQGKRPFLATEEFCSRCPRVEWDQESWLNVGCLLATIVPLFLMILFWLFFFMGFIFR